MYADLFLFSFSARENFLYNHEQNLKKIVHHIFLYHKIFFDIRKMLFLSEKWEEYILFN